MLKNQYGSAVPGMGSVGPDALSDDESTPLQMESENVTSQQTAMETKGWNVFRDPPAKVYTSSMTNQDCLELTLKITKGFVYLLVFVIVSGCSVIAIGTTLFMTSQLRVDRTILYCNRWLGTSKTFIARLPEEERIAWIWCIIFVFAIPEIGTLIRSVRMCLFKALDKPTVRHFILVGTMETFHVLGLAIMFIGILPELDVIQGAMLTNCVCFVPGLLGLLSRNEKRDDSKRFIFVLVDFAALAAQATAFVTWPLLRSSNGSLWLLPIALIMVSCGWWENYVSVQSPLFLMKILSRVKDEMKTTRYFTYAFVSVWKIIVFFISSVIILQLKGNTATHLFTMFGTAFSPHNITINEVQSIVGGGTIPDLSDVLPNGLTTVISSSFTTPIYVSVIQVLSAYFTYITGKFACKILIQGFSYALPINLTVPVSISLLVTACALRTRDPCFFNGIVPNYLFYEAPLLSFLTDFLWKEYAWVWLLWLLSQTWITLHIWTPKCERLASTEKLFVVPMYNGLLINQSMSLNRNRDDQPEINLEEPASREREESDSEDETIYEHSGNSARPPSMIKKSDLVTKIYACATMWHENKDEMLDFLKSILRLDLDQCARKNAQKFLNIVDPNYYEFETHIFFDDAFEISDHDENESQVNRFVKLLVQVLDEAASDIHQTRIHVRAPKKYPTPYGGRLVWTLPGNTKMIAHLKDKSKIRHRKRWSQVMYMYYLLGYRIMDLPISIPRKEVIAENTYLLTLDGDIDFQPTAVKRLIDLMKKNANLGAACGRIHPVGSGPMVWYQMFEYAIGHWLQKATEHMIGCVLCSPGCFSLFRAKALMDDSVMKKYTTSSSEAKHYVQYDQGEDRWLCTLLLQRGYRVEYSAASDAYTHAPEGFNEFYNQRRRWVPSTMANIMDLLINSKRTIRNNDNISTLYMFYQILLMVGTILGPGTIFLMLVGSFVAAFQISIMTSLYYNIFPVLLFMIVCFTCKSNVQLFVAAVVSIIYGLVMMAVIVGILIQMSEDGWMSPSSLFLFLVIGQLVIAGLMHPQELMCLPCGIIYYITIPSMYMLLVIYSITNLNVVTWGTREVQVKKTLAELEQEKKELEESKQKAKNKSFLGLLQNGNGKDDDRGSIEFSLAGLCKCMLCTHGKPSDEKLQLIAVSECLDQVIGRLDSMERPNDLHEHAPGWRPTPASLSRFNQDPMNPIEEDLINNEEQDSDTETTVSQNTEANRKRTFLVSPYWLDDEGLKKGEVDFLSAREEQFWDDLIEEYLYPIEDDKKEKERIASDLKDLRNNSSFAFFMLNALFVLIIFLMQLNQDLLHIEWPLGARCTITFDETSLEINIMEEYLQLEPIGLVFVLFFGLILLIQFTAMLFHRFGTFSHIIASTTLQAGYCCKTTEEISEEALLSRDAIEIVKDLQRLDSIEDDKEISPRRPCRRNTVRNLEKSRRRTQKINNNLEDTFRERFFSLSEGSGFPRRISTRRSTRAFKAFEARRNTVISERKKSQMMNGVKNNLYETPDKSLGLQLRTPGNSQTHANETFRRRQSGVINFAFEPEESLTDCIDNPKIDLP